MATEIETVGREAGVDDVKPAVGMTYHKPQLRRLGALAELTRSGGGTVRDTPVTGGPVISPAG
jgi:hypothetical protein